MTIIIKEALRVLWLLLQIKKITKKAKTHFWYNDIYVNVPYTVPSLLSILRLKHLLNFVKEVTQIQQSSCNSNYCYSKSRLDRRISFVPSEFPIKLSQQNSCNLNTHSKTFLNLIVLWVPSAILFHVIRILFILNITKELI